MSVSGNYFGGLEFTLPTTLTDGTATAVHTARSKYETLASFALVNDTASPITATCYHRSASTDRIFYKKQVPANDSLEVKSIPRKLKEGDIFKVAAAANLTVVPTIIAWSSNEVSPNANRSGFGA